MFQTSDDFYKKIGLITLETGAPQFYDNSMIVKPSDGRSVVCHASAWDMFDADKKDFRIKQCTTVAMDDFIVIHHEMGHTQYQMQYKNQPTLFREGANPGFHEAIGDVMALSVSTPKHLQGLNLIETWQPSDNASLAFLLRTALQKVAFLPFAYTMDTYRWTVFREEVQMDQWNRKWWELTEKNLGIKPPVMRTNEDFDAGCKFHTLSDVSYVQYFVSFVIQFSFHEALCIAAGQYDPNSNGPNAPKLHECDISAATTDAQKNLVAEKLNKLMSSGASRPWPEVMAEMTGRKQMSASSLLKYFKPLEAYLDQEIIEKKIKVGWKSEMDFFMAKE
jgi:peptidyl-dipeptidase A